MLGTLIEFSEDTDTCDRIANQIIEESLSVRQAEKLVSSLKRKPQPANKQLNLFENYVENCLKSLIPMLKLNIKK